MALWLIAASLLTFVQFLADAASRGEVVNVLFEERLFGLVGILHRITDALMPEQIPYEVIGGLAVLIHVQEANPELSGLTRDVDLLVQRSDLERITLAAQAQGFRFQHTSAADMLLSSDPDSAKNAVHLIFSRESAGYAAPAPAIDPEPKSILGKEVMVIPVPALVQMKLTSFRDKDRVHIRSLDATGLITTAVEAKLPPELLSRLTHVRQTE